MARRRWRQRAAPLSLLAVLTVAGCASTPPEVTLKEMVGMVLRGWCAQQSNCITDHKNPRSE